MTTAGYAEFGPLVVETDVDRAVLDTLRLWMPQYLRQFEAERQLTPGLFSRPKAESYANTIEDDEWLDHRLPAVIVTTASTTGQPQRSGDGLYYAAWQVRVSAVVRGEMPAQARAIAAVFGGTVRRILVGPNLPDPVTFCEWGGSLIARVDPGDQGRYLAAAINTFTAYTDQILQQGAGPIDPGGPYPDPDPGGDPTGDGTYDGLALVDTVTTTVHAKPGSE
jgi:hypothetical protein